MLSKYNSVQPAIMFTMPTTLSTHTMPINPASKTAVKIQIQNQIFTLGATLAADPDKPKLKKPDLVLTDIEKLETEIDKMNETLISGGRLNSKVYT